MRASRSPQVAAHHRSDVGVDHGGRGALVLPVLRADHVRERHGRRGQQLLEEAAHQRLVRRVAVGVQEAHGHRLHALPLEPGRRPLDGGGVQRQVHVAVDGEPLRDLAAQVARHERQGLGPEHVVEVVVGAVQPPDLVHVPEPRRGQEGGAGSLALQEGVGGHRGPVREQPDRRRRRTQLGERDPQPLDDGESRL
jgi:hypothetical protein